MACAARVANPNRGIAQHWVDYSRNQRTVRDPTTGQVSSGVSWLQLSTWVDASGPVCYQTNDANANRNGSLPGTWIRQQVAHGDGSN